MDELTRRTLLYIVIEAFYIINIHIYALGPVRSKTTFYYQTKWHAKHTLSIYTLCGILYLPCLTDGMTKCIILGIIIIHYITYHIYVYKNLDKSRVERKYLFHWFIFKFLFCVVLSAFVVPYVLCTYIV